MKVLDNLLVNSRKYLITSGEYLVIPAMHLEGSRKGPGKKKQNPDDFQKGKFLPGIKHCHVWLFVRLFVLKRQGKKVKIHTIHTPSSLMLSHRGLTQPRNFLCHSSREWWQMPHPRRWLLHHRRWLASSNRSRWTVPITFLLTHTSPSE